MPVFPVVLSVANAEFVLDTLLAHQLMKAHGEVEEEIVVAAVDEYLLKLEGKN